MRTRPQAERMYKCCYLLFFCWLVGCWLLAVCSWLDVGCQVLFDVPSWLLDVARWSLLLLLSLGSCCWSLDVIGAAVLGCWLSATGWLPFVVCCSFWGGGVVVCGGRWSVVDYFFKFVLQKFGFGVS